MFDFIRNNNKAIQIILFIFVIPSFFLFGIEGYSRFNDKGEVVATVGGTKIMQTEWDAEHKAEIDRRRNANPNADVKSLDSPAFKYAVLERMVNQKMMGEAASYYKLNVSDQRLARELINSPLVAGLKGPDGKLDMQRYKELAAAQGLTPEGFEARLRQDLSASQVVSSLAQSEMSGTAVVGLSLKAYYEKREVQIWPFKPSDFASQITISDEDVQTQYKSQLQQYRTEETADVQYVMLDLDAVKKTISVSDADLKSYYDQNAAKLAGQEERKLSHILIAAAKSASSDQRSAAKAKAQELLGQVKKSPVQFATLAKAHSQDPGSADNGGDLGFVTRGAMVKPFEDAAFALKKGDISPVVETEFGYHIITAVDIKLPAQKSFENLKSEIETEVKKQMAQKKFAEAAETFTNLVYEQSDSLKPAADKFGLEIKTFSNLKRTGAPIPKTLFANGKLVDALFAPDALDKKRNTQAIETGSSQLVSARITRHMPAATLPLEAVQDKVRAQLLASKSAQTAKEQGASQLSKLQADAAAPNKAENAVVISRDSTAGQNTQLVEAVLKVKPTSLPQWIGVDLGLQGYAIAKINKIVEADLKDPTQLRQQYAQVWLGGESQAYLTYLKERMKVDIKVKKPV